METPYTAIELRDVSINRQGNPRDPISKISDVLYNVEPGAASIRYDDKGVVVLVIKHIIPPDKYKKTFQEAQPQSDVLHTVTMELIHDPLNCMYPHCVFRFFYNGELVTDENYDRGLGRDNKTLSKLRKKCKAELNEMIVRREVSFES